MGVCKGSPCIRREGRAQSSPKAGLPGGEELTPVASGARAPVEYGDCGDCSREAATGKSQTCPEDLGKEMQGGDSLREAVPVTAEPRASGYLVNANPTI